MGIVSDPEMTSPQDAKQGATTEKRCERALGTEHADCPTLANGDRRTYSTGIPGPARQEVPICRGEASRTRITRLKSPATGFPCFCESSPGSLPRGGKNGPSKAHRSKSPCQPLHRLSRNQPDHRACLARSPDLPAPDHCVNDVLATADQRGFRRTVGDSAGEGSGADWVVHTFRRVWLVGR